MIKPSSEFRQVMTERRNFINYADVTLANGTVLHLEPKDFRIGGNTIVDSTSSGSSFSVGNAIGKSITLRIENSNDQYSQYDFYMARIVVYAALPLAETTEKIRKGTYTVTTPESTGSVIEITAVDDMYKLDRSYDEGTLLYPTTLQEILTDACLTCGVSIGFTQFDLYSQTIAEKPTGVTYRQVVSYAAQLAGYNARINNSNALQLIWYDMSVLDRAGIDGGTLTGQDSDTTIDGGDFTDYTGDIYDGGDFASLSSYHNLFALKGLKIGTDDVVITGVKVTNGDTVATNGADGYVMEVKDNPFVKGIEQLAADHLGSKLTGMRFRPFSCSHLADPTIEAGDVAFLNDTKGNVYQTVITNVTFTTGSYTVLACSAENPLKNGSTYTSKAAQAVVEARRNTEKQLTDYDKAVQNMSELAVNAMGFYESSTEEIDGSKISYMHNKPTYEESMIIYKKSIDGFFLSLDGGESWTSGFDSSGNAVLNILYAVGIVCDWIRGGTLTLGGDNNVNGLLKVLDAGGGEVCKINKDGLDVIAGKLGNIKINYNGLGSNTLGQSLNGLWLYDDGDFGFSKGTSTGSYASFFSTLASGNILLYTGRGSSTVGEGIIINNVSYGESQSSVIRVGSQAVERNYSEYAVFQSSSDRRIKKFIRDVKSDFVKSFFGKLRVVRFRYKKAELVNDKRIHYGVIAQELSEVLKEIGCEDSNIIETNEHGYLHVNYHELDGFELAGIKDLYKISDNQQAEIKDLYEKLESQRKQIDEQAELIQKLIEKVGDV